VNISLCALHLVKLHNTPHTCSHYIVLAQNSYHFHDEMEAVRQNAYQNQQKQFRTQKTSIFSPWQHTNNASIWGTSTSLSEDSVTVTCDIRLCHGGTTITAKDKLALPNLKKKKLWSGGNANA
jgi:hypothetical protein